MMAGQLEEYNKKRDFTKTREPEGKPAEAGEALRFVVQKHDARRRHFDFRLEQSGVLWSWAVPKGPSFNPKDKRLAVHVEDHPLDYRNFEGTIPEGEYGGGTVMLFDEGVWIPEGDPVKGLADGSLKFTLEGERLKGRWTLIRMKPKPGEEDKNWLLIKEKDEYVQDSDGISGFTTSVRSGRTMEDISRDEPTSFASNNGSSSGSAAAARTEDNNSGRESNSGAGEPDQTPVKKVPVKRAAAKQVTAEKAAAKQNTAEPAAANQAAARTTQSDESKPALARTEGSQSPFPDLSGALPFQEAKPMLAVLVKQAPEGGEWIHELKLDGYRLLAFLEKGKARLITRNGHDWSHRVPDLVATLEAWNPGNLVLDGELVVMDEGGRSDFQALQAYFKKPGDHYVDYVIFDLLAAGEEDLRTRPLLQRKARLEELLKDSPAGLHYNPHTEGRAIFDKVCQADMEGIISKRKASPYRSTRSDDWVKTKCQYRREFVIGGYTTSDKSTTGLSSLLLGVYEGESLIYKGRAGTGFGQAEARDLMAQFQPLLRKTSPFTKVLKLRPDEGITYLNPELVAEVRFAEVTDDGLLRQASFQGLRGDKPAREVTFEIPEDISSEDAPDEPRNETDGDSAGDAAEKRRANPGAGKAALKKKTLRPDSPAEPPAETTVVSPAHPQEIQPQQSPQETTTNQELKRTPPPEGKKVSPGQEKKATPREGMEDPAMGSKDRKTTSDQEVSALKAKTVSYGEIALSSPDRLVFPEDGITKQDVADYYWAVREIILPYLADRPMTLIRCTDSIGDCFFQKHLNQSIPGMDTAEVPDNDGKAAEAMILRDAKGLMGAVQMGTLEFHGWGAKLGQVEQPDWMVFDLDPDEGMALETVRKGVRELKALLDELDLQSFLKTSGGKGYHVVVPLTPSANWEQIRSFARGLAQTMEMKSPQHYTANLRKDKRQGRIYIDWVRNGRGATSVSVFSLRGRRGAPLSWPIGWSDLEWIAPNQVTLKNFREYLKTVGSWDEFFTVKQRIK